MTTAQWLFEAYAAREADKRTQAWQRTLLTRLLGLDLVRPAGGTGDEFVPLSLICGQPEALKAIFEEAEAESGAEDALHDQDFDAFSEALARGEDPFADDLLPAEDTPAPTPRSGQVSFDDDDDDG